MKTNNRGIVMSEELEQKLLKQIAQLQKEVKELKGLDENSKPTYQYSKIRDIDLDSLVDIEKKLNINIFDNWLKRDIKIDNESEIFFENIIKKNEMLIDDYNEEDLKVNVIIPILNRVEFKSFENEFRDFYELSLRYETDKFVFKGAIDYAVSKGLVKSKKPYFFIQEFKKSEEYGNPRPQLLAELISGVELNQYSEIKGAYIVGAIWHFVILKKLDINRYEYFVSKGFDSMDIKKLKAIYKNLLVVKNEIIEEIKRENS